MSTASNSLVPFPTNVVAATDFLNFNLLILHFSHVQYTGWDESTVLFILTRLTGVDLGLTLLLSQNYVVQVSDCGSG